MSVEQIFIAKESVALQDADRNNYYVISGQLIKSGMLVMPNYDTASITRVQIQTPAENLSMIKVPDSSATSLTDVAQLQARINELEEQIAAQRELIEEYDEKLVKVYSVLVEGRAIKPFVDPRSATKM